MTNINQASEDELRANIDKALHIDWAFNKSKPTKIIIDGSATKGAYHTSYDLFVDNIIDLIRTEKLKLLAEVMERVVGEDVELNSFEIPVHEAEFVITSVTQQNHLRADQRTALTKLEAEL